MDNKIDMERIKYIINSKKNKISIEDAKIIFNIIEDYNETNKCVQSADGVNVALDDLSDELIYDIYQLMINRLKI
jgi:hypothetical protein